MLNFIRVRPRFFSHLNMPNHQLESVFCAVQVENSTQTTKIGRYQAQQKKSGE
jgi:hypothetical protein